MDSTAHCAVVVLDPHTHPAVIVGRIVHAIRTIFHSCPENVLWTSSGLHLADSPAIELTNLLFAHEPEILPYGVYDPTHNHGWVSVGIEHDTQQCAVESIRRWWCIWPGVYPRRTRPDHRDAGGAMQSQSVMEGGTQKLAVRSRSDLRAHFHRYE